jgi:hypothetical protein
VYALPVSVVEVAVFAHLIRVRVKVRVRVEVRVRIRGRDRLVPPQRERHRPRACLRGIPGVCRSIIHSECALEGWSLEQ